MAQVDPFLQLPTSAELPSSDDTPVDNEDQNFIPNILLFLLQFIWGDRYLAPEELEQQAQQSLQQTQRDLQQKQQRADRFAARLRELGIDPDSL